ncbi:hypothetical protein MMC30_008860 [Trapelia coarctata]|nr:hypothetical protein [Trapelia coarctata]
MDPLSVTANTFAILGFVSQSSHFLYHFFRGVAEAPSDVQQNGVVLHALHDTFLGIRSLYVSHSSQIGFTAGFPTRLEGCLEDFRAVESKIRKADEMLKKGRIRRTWARLKWSSSADHWLGDFFVRLQTYQTMFSLELATLQLRLSVSHHGSGAPNPGDNASGHTQGHLVAVPRTQLLLQTPLPQESRTRQAGNVTRTRLLGPSNPATTSEGLKDSEPFATAGELPNDPVSNSTSLPRGRLAKFLRSYAEPSSVQTKVVGRYTTKMLSVFYWFGPIVMKRLTQNGEEIFKVGPAGSAYGCGLTIRFPWYHLGRLDLVLFALNEVSTARSLSLRWSLSFPRIVPFDAQVMKHARNSDVNAIKELFQGGKATCSDMTQDGTSLLHVAASLNAAELVRYLLDQGANVNAADDDGESPLHVALARAKDYNVSRLLLERGGDICNRGADGRTPTHTYPNETVRRVLLCHGKFLEASIRDCQGMTSVHYLAWSSKTTVADIQVILAGDPSCLSIKDNGGRSILHFAAQRGNCSLLRYVLSLPNTPSLCDADVEGKTVMHYAVESKRIQTIDLVYKHGGNISAIDKQGRTALHIAAMKGNMEAVKRVLQLGGSEQLLRRDLARCTPAQLAASSGNAATATYLEQVNGVPMEPENIPSNTGCLISFEKCQSLEKLHTWWKCPGSGLFRLCFGMVAAFLIILIFMILRESIK